MTIFDFKGASKVIQSTSESEPDHETAITKKTSKMGKILTTFGMGNILRTYLTSEIILLEENQTSENNKHNKQQAKNQLFSNDQNSSNKENKTKTENKDKRLSKIPINI